MAQSARQQRIPNPAHAAHRGPADATCTNPLWAGQLPSSKAQQKYIVLSLFLHTSAIHYVYNCSVQEYNASVKAKELFKPPSSISILEY